MEEIGFIGALLLALCALPQAVLSIINGNSNGLSHIFLWMWYLGELFMLQYVVDTVGLSGPLFWNYLANTILVSILVFYKHFPRTTNG